MDLWVDEGDGDVIRGGVAGVADGDDEGVVVDESLAYLSGAGDDGLRLEDGDRWVLGGADRKHPKDDHEAAYEVEACACVHPKSHHGP